MAACDPYIYTYTKACPYPNYGHNFTSVTPPKPHLDLSTHFLQGIFGTSRFSEILNACLIIVIAVAVFIFVILPIARIVLDILDYRRLRNRKLVFLELTPPALSVKTPLATIQFCNAVHGLLSASTHASRFLRRKNIMAMELATPGLGGIRFIAPIDPDDEPVFRMHMASYLKTVRVAEVEDYLPDDLLEQDVDIADFKQIGNLGYSLAEHIALEQHDPMGQIAGAMTKSLPEEVIAYQLVFSPASRRVAAKIQAKLMHGQDPGMHREWWHYPFIILLKLVKVVLSIFVSLLELIGDEITGNRASRPKPNGYSPQPVHPMTQHVIKDVHAKLAQPLFDVSIRALVIGDKTGQRMQGLTNSLYQFNVPGYQGLRERRRFPRKYTKPYRLNAFRYRLPTMLSSNANVLAASEVAALYHFPYGETSQTEDMVSSVAKTLPAPLSMKRHADAADYDVMLGMNHHHGSDTVIGLSAKEREKHVYLLGGTGNGKTTMLEYAIVQDIRSGKGVALIDPHGDAAQKLLRYIPKSRLNDVVYLNPIDIKHPIGINLLELPEGLDEDDLLIEKERVTEAVISVMRKVFADDDANAHRIEAMLRNAIQTAFTIEGATLFTILKLFRNAEYRNAVVAKLEDEYLKDFWREEFGQAGNMQRVSMSKGVNHRIDRFRSSAPASRMLDQVKSTISFEDIIDSGKILICNFSTDMGEDTSTLFGTTVLAKLKIAAERRARLPEDERKPFYVYVDEFQNFATTPFLKMLSASRKYKLFLTLAQQTTAQQEEQRLTEAILANVSTIVCFSLGSPADEKLLLQRFTPYIEKGALTNLPAYNFYIRVKAEEPMEPTSGETTVLPKEQASQEQAERVVAASRLNYATTYVKPKPQVKQQPPEGQSKQAKAVVNKPLKHKKKKS